MDVKTVPDRTATDFMVNEECLPELQKYVPDFFLKRQYEVKDIHKFLKEEQYLQVKKICHQGKGFCKPLWL